MAADSERDSFHVNRVRSGDVTIILSAQSYRPAVLDAIRAVKAMDSWGRLQDLCGNRLGPGPHPSYRDSGHPCLKTKNISGMLADIEPAGWVDPADARRLPWYQVQSGDVLVNLTGAGSIGRVAVYFGEERPLTNQHIARMEIKPPHNSGFVAAFLSSWWGERAIEQGISGATGQLNLVNDHLRDIAVPTPRPEAQEYIGAKVRQAEVLRAYSRRLRLKLESFLHSLLSRLGKLNYPESYRVHSVDLRNRVDPKYYYPDIVALRRALARASLPISSIAIDVSNGFEHRSFVKAGRPYLTVAEIRDHCLAPESAPRISWDVAVPLRALAHERCVLTARTGAIGAAVVPLEEDAGAAISSDLIRLEFRSATQAAAVSAFLSSYYGKALQMAAAYGAVQPHLNQEELSEILVPSAVLAEEQTLYDALHGIGQSERATRRLTEAAVLLVELLISGSVTESDLIAAHKSPARDRALLSRLKERGGSSVEPVPLIPDVGMLQSLIEIAAGNIS